MHSSTDGVVINQKYDLTEVPIFVRGGAVVGTLHVARPCSSADGCMLQIPQRNFDPHQTVGMAQQQYTDLVLDIYPGASSGSTDVG